MDPGPVRTEIIDAEQIRKSKKAHGGGKPRPQVREKDWSARERGEGVQRGGQRARRKKVAREKDKENPQAPERTLVVGPWMRGRRFPDA